MKKIFALTVVTLGLVAVGPASGVEQPIATEDAQDLAANHPDGRKAGALEVTPLGLLVGHYGGSIELVPFAHHAVVVSAYYARTVANDAEFVMPDPQPDPLHPVRAPLNTFSGLGGELGYRYYFGALGPQGLYVGPSFLVGSFQTDMARSTTTRTRIDYKNYGGAIDVGYQVVVGPVVMGISAGAQYVYVDGMVPSPADLFPEVHTNSAVRPRASIAIGLAF